MNARSKSQLINDVTWFYQYLNMLIQDLTREAQGYRLDTYFDTKDVWPIIQGMDQFYGTMQLDSDSFEDQKALVQSLASANWLGPVKVLPPHQAEVLSLLRSKRNETRPNEKEFIPKAKLFLDQILAEFCNMPAPPGDLTAESLLQYLLEGRLDVGHRFKALECVRYGFWPVRLGFLTQKGILLLPADHFSFESIAQDEDYTKFKRAFDEQRADQPVNNIADAVAMAILLRRFRDQKDRSIPRFYDSSDLFRKVAARIGHRDALSLLRDTDYYIFRASFAPNSEVIDESLRRDQKQLLDSLRDFRSRIEPIRQSPERISEDVLQGIYYGEKSLSEHIEELKKISFLERVWLPYVNKEEVEEIIKRVEWSEVHNLEYEQVQKAENSVIKSIEKNAIAYRSILDVMKIMDILKKKWNKRVDKRGEVPDPIKVLGLVRFGFPKESESNIVEILRILMSRDEDDTIIDQAKNSVAMALSRVLQDPQRSESANDLSLVAAIGWVSEDYRNLRELLSGLKLLHPSIKMCLAACCIEERNRQYRDKGLKLLDELKGELHDCPPEERGRMLTRLSFLSFRAARALGQKTYAHLRQGYGQFKLEGQKGRYATEAVEFAEAAMELAKEEDSEHVYVTNLYLYYASEVSDNEHHIQKMEVAADELNELRPTADWTYRYSDTMARYERRKAMAAKGQREWDRYMALAERDIKAAVEEGPWDRLGESLLLTITKELEAGYASSRGMSSTE